MRKLFTERHGQAPPRIAEALDDATRNALLTLVSAAFLNDDRFPALSRRSGSDVRFLADRFCFTLESKPVGCLVQRSEGDPKATYGR